jgi:deoxycytidylate deaminase
MKTMENTKGSISHVINEIFNLRKNFVIIGLTGKTGCGCSTVADLLKNKDFKDLKFPEPSASNKGLQNDERKYRIAYSFLKKNWKPFHVIKASDIIMFFVLLTDYEKLIESLPENVKGCFDKAEFVDIQKKVESFNEYIEDRKSILFRNNAKAIKKKDGENDIKQIDLDKEESKIKGYIDLITDELPKYVILINEKLANCNVKRFAIYQEWGNNIRRNNEAISDNSATGSIEKLYDKAPSYLVEKINKIIKFLRDVNKVKEGLSSTLFVIDALRNPYEILYFRERYSAFYLMSINAEESVRRNNLVETGFNNLDIENLDKKESPEEIPLLDSFVLQNIQKCIELSDIHIVNNGKPLDHNIDIKNQLVRYLTLMFHPGLLPPSPMERIMQIALTAKLNSGCLSRQVGAVVTDKNFSVKSIGWNTSPQGQAPCTLRSFFDLANLSDRSAYSRYEKEDEKFRKQVKDLNEKAQAIPREDDLCGLTLSYCFKDIHNRIKCEKNQVHTRSLHAEENAFLQLAKYGSGGIEGGKLFTTASPCVLCAKKAYQLGIKEIYYIDAYPDISTSHILECGDNPPKSILFSGAIGRAYHNLYQPFIPLKDELEARTDFPFKEKNVDKKESK